jgi:hypothetical protein
VHGVDKKGMLNRHWGEFKQIVKAGIVHNCAISNVVFQWKSILF